MEENLAQQSINFALCCKWKEAIKANLKILKIEPDDIDAMNRLAKAYFENDEVKKATLTSKKVLRLDPNNNIATNSLDRFRQKKTNNDQIKRTSFIEEPGKTKITTLINLGSEKVYSCLSAGDEVCIVTHAHKVSVTTTDGKYIGKLTDDLSARMRLLIQNRSAKKSGKKFQIYIKSINKNLVKVFITSNAICFPLDMSESLGEFNT